MVTAVGVTGALAAATVALPLVPAPHSPAATPAPSPPPQGGGYRLSAHVQRYYQTAKV